MNIFKQTLHFIDFKNQYRLKTSILELKSTNLHPLAEQLIEVLLQYSSNHYVNYNYVNQVGIMHDIIQLAISQLIELNKEELEQILFLFYTETGFSEYKKLNPKHIDNQYLVNHLIDNQIYSATPFDTHNYTKLLLEREIPIPLEIKAIGLDKYELTDNERTLLIAEIVECLEHTKTSYNKQVLQYALINLKDI